MWEAPTYEELKAMYSEEVLWLCSINERYDNENDIVKDIRGIYANLFMILTERRDVAWRWEAGRNYAIAITELENSCIRAVKWFYSKD